MVSGKLAHLRRGPRRNFVGVPLGRPLGVLSFLKQLIGPSRLGSVDLHLFDGVSSVNDLILAPRGDPRRAHPEIKRQTELQLITNVQHQNLLKYF